MARWFGYRQGFEDLIRIYMPNDHILWYNSIFKLEEGLRSDFEENNDPDNPVMVISLFLGISKLIFFKLCVLAPLTKIFFFMLKK